MLIVGGSQLWRREVSGIGRGVGHGGLRSSIVATAQRVPMTYRPAGQVRGFRSQQFRLGSSFQDAGVL